MKKITLKLTFEEFHYLTEYLSEVRYWIDPTTQVLRIKQVGILENCIRISIASVIQKMAIAYSVKLAKYTTEYKEKKSVSVILRDGEAEALYAFFRLQSHRFPIYIYNSIINQIAPKF